MSEVPDFPLGHEGPETNQDPPHLLNISFHQLGCSHLVIAPHPNRSNCCKGTFPQVLGCSLNRANHVII